MFEELTAIIPENEAGMTFDAWKDEIVKAGIKPLSNNSLRHLKADKAIRMFFGEHGELRVRRGGTDAK